MLFYTLLLMIFINPILDHMSDDEYLIFYPAYGYEKGENWVIPMRIYVYEYRPATLRSVTSLVRRYRKLSSNQAEIFSRRAQDFVVDSESREIVQFVFDGDPLEEKFSLSDEDGNTVRSNLNGTIIGNIKISKERAAQISANQSGENGWLTIRAVSDEHTGTGMVNLIPPQGLSVISDVDDTIKITEIPAGSQIVIRNTLYKEFTPAQETAELYNSFEEAEFHYVTGAPWQLFRPLSELAFGENASFPRGTFHMKTVTKNFLSLNTWRDLWEVATNMNVTYEQKLEQITQILHHFPERDFILSGDSGEADPEVFRKVKEMFPDQIKEIYIRDVINARELQPERLEGMIIIPAPTVEPGVSQFEW